MPSVVGTITKGAAFTHLIDGGGVKGSVGDPPDSGGEIVVQVKTTTGPPTHAASLGALCWNSVDEDLYINSVADVGPWIPWSKAGHGHVLDDISDDGALAAKNTVATGDIDDAAVTLAKLADLAQDQFIGRVTASTGVPETATITAAARTVLAEAATSTGTGGIVRASSPTLVTPALGAASATSITGLGAPSGGSDAANKDYVDALANGLDWKASVRVATTAAGTLATDFENGDTIDGVVLATGDRILIKDQTAGSENGIYIVNATGAPTRSADADVSAEVTSGMSCLVSEGTANADKVFVLTTNDPITLDTTALVFAQLAGGSYTHPNHTGDVTSAGDGEQTFNPSAITAAARTVLDDATVTAMVDTLGGATSTGTGGIARATSPTFVTPALGTPASGVLTNCTGLPPAGTTTALRERTRFIYVEDPTSVIALALGFEKNAVTLTKVYGETDAGTVTLQIQKRAFGSQPSAGTDMLSSAMVAGAGASKATTTSFAVSGAVGAEHGLFLVTSAVSGGPAKLWVAVTYTVD